MCSAAFPFECICVEGIFVRVEPIMPFLDECGRHICNGCRRYCVPVSDGCCMFVDGGVRYT
jgi:hypothetical protein